MTPWGPADLLRERRLRPGPGTPPAEVAANQRERLFGAMVASVAERGYKASSLSYLAELSGVSRRTIYSLFGDKEACFAATVEALLKDSSRKLEEALRDADRPEEQVRALLLGLAEVAAQQPAAAKVCLIESHGVGAGPWETIDAATKALEDAVARCLWRSPERVDMPKEFVIALVGSIGEISRKLLDAGREEELPELVAEVVELLLSYESPPARLRLANRPSKLAPESLEGPDQRERVLRALTAVAAEKGFAATKVDEVIERASMSATTFYANFNGKEDALLAAIESAGARLLAAVLPAYRHHGDWPSAVRAAIGAMLNFLASRPALARLLLVEVYAAGPGALGARDRALRPLEVLLAGAEQGSEGDRLRAWAIAEAAYTLCSRQVAERGAASLPGLAPILTYIALAPFLGSEGACAAANGSGAGRAGGERRAEREADSPAPEWLAALLASRTAGAGEIGPLGDVGSVIETLLAKGLIEALEDREIKAHERSAMGLIPTKSWAKLERPERERISARILELIFAEVHESVEKGMFDDRVDRFLARFEIVVDAAGWKRLVEIHERTLLETMIVHREAAMRLADEGEPAIGVRSVQLMFELPEGSSLPDQP